MSARHTTCSAGLRRRRWTTASRRRSRGSKSGAQLTPRRTGRSNVRRARMSSRMASKSPPGRDAPRLRHHPGVPLSPHQASTVVALFGPTASGKTAVAGILREQLGADVISADSAALYEGLPVITAAPEYPTRLVGLI